MAYKIRVGDFEGPFDLLVYLIENARMSIYDIQISVITKQYLEYVNELKNMDVNLGSEFMVLAAQLIEIKAKMLIPRNTESADGIVEEDPRSQLVERILEYRRFKEASKLLEQREEDNLRIYEKPQEDISEYQNNPDEYLSLSTDEFLKAFNAFLHRKQKVEEVRKRYVRVKRERESVDDRMMRIRNVFRLKKVRKVSFKELVADAKDKYDVVLSFTVMLEMMKARQLNADQNVIYGEITVTSLEEDNNDNKENN